MLLVLIGTLFKSDNKHLGAFFKEVCVPCGIPAQLLMDIFLSV